MYMGNGSKKTNTVYGGFWNPEALIATGKPLLIDAEPRGVGKSTGSALYCMEQYYKKREKFIYCRRTDDELKRTCKSYFDGACKIYNDFYGTAHEWIYDKGGTYTDENGDIVGYSVPLNLADKYKSATFGADGVRLIIYDEFILRRGKETGYLGKTGSTIEYDLLIGLYQTVDRAPGHRFLNETKILCLGNFASLNAPVLIGAGADLYVEHGAKFINPKHEMWALRLQGDFATDKDIEESYGYKLASRDTRGVDYGYEAAERPETIIPKMTGERHCMMCVIYRDRRYGVWTYDQKGIVYISRECLPGMPEIALTAGNTPRINRITALKWRDMPSMQLLRDAAEMGYLCFDSNRARTDILTYLDFTD